jgi:hypothetical protein
VHSRRELWGLQRTSSTIALDEELGLSLHGLEIKRETGGAIPINVDAAGSSAPTVIATHAPNDMPPPQMDVGVLPRAPDGRTEVVHFSAPFVPRSFARADAAKLNRGGAAIRRERLLPACFRVHRSTITRMRMRQHHRRSNASGCVHITTRRRCPPSAGGSSAPRAVRPDQFLERVATTSAHERRFHKITNKTGEFDGVRDGPRCQIASHDDVCCAMECQ